MSTIKLSDIMKNNQIGGATVNLDVNAAPKIEGITTSPDLKYLILYFNQSIAQPTFPGTLKLKVTVGAVEKNADFHSYYGDASPAKALQFNLDAALKTELTNNPSARIVVKFDNDQNVDRNGNAPQIADAQKLGFVGTSANGILSKLGLLFKNIEYWFFDLSVDIFLV